MRKSEALSLKRKILDRRKVLLSRAFFDVKEYGTIGDDTHELALSIIKQKNKLLKYAKKGKK